jgi:hypothetical protein
MPLRPSLHLRQICNRRLGINNPNMSRFKLSDTYVGNHMVLSDFEITKDLDPDRPFTSINFDLRRQQYASDVLLIFEIRRESVREALVKRLVPFRSNSIVVPALAGIWACAEGLSVSFRYSDWDSHEILNRLENIIRQATASTNSAVTVVKEDGAWHFSLKGSVSGEFSATIVAPPSILKLERAPDLMIRCAGSPLKFDSDAVKQVVLAESLDIAMSMRSTECLSEDINDLAFENQSGIMFEDYDHHQDVYDVSGDTRQLVSPFVSDDDLQEFDKLVRVSVIQEHVHFRIDVHRLENAVRAFKAESHRMVLLYLCAASEDIFLLDLAMAISDIWWYVYQDKQLQLISEAVGQLIRDGKAVTEEKVMHLFEKIYLDDGSVA